MHEDIGHNPKQTEAVEKCLEENECDGELKEKRNVHFKDGDLTLEFDDGNLWAGAKLLLSLT